MKSMVKWWSILVPAVLATCLAGCGDNSPLEPASPQDADDTSGSANAELADSGDTTDATADADTIPDATSDTVSDIDATADAATDAIAESDADVVTTDTADVTTNADVTTDADGLLVSTVSVIAPLPGRYTLGESLQVVWETTNADEVTLSLVAGFGCPEGEADVVVPELASFAASTTAYVWAVPTTLAPGEYRVRVRASATVPESAVGCSPAFSLQQPLGCTELGCAAQNRACSTDSGTAVCGSCVDGFSDSDGVCAVVDCGAVPAAPANATFAGISSTRFGGVVTYRCGEGYSIDGVAGAAVEVARRCGADGAWEAASGVCAPVECGVYPAPATQASFQGGTRTTFGGQASYSCVAGYVVAGTGGSGYTLTCNATGSWDTPPACEAVDCGALTNPANGAVSIPVGTTFGATATYSCDEGYLLSGGLATRTCGATGSWGTAPTCNEIDECTSGAVCAAPNNVCTNLPGSWQCSCAIGATGVTVVGGDASCVSGLGSLCTSDSECPSNSWCSTVSGYRRCSPRVFSGAAHQMDFVFIPSGTFQQGTEGEGSGEQQFTATISRNYFVSRTEVTQGQWQAATVGINGSCFQTISGNSCTIGNGNNDGPVEQVTWYSALLYANWLSVSQGLSACYTFAGCSGETGGWYDGSEDRCTGAAFEGLTCTGYRLLTESEWERAARGNTTTTFYWGDATDTETVSLYAWFFDNSGDRTQRVGIREANAFGLYDMSGNVVEWVWDWYGPNPSSSSTDYTGLGIGSTRARRGGGWGGNDVLDLRSAFRFGNDPSSQNYLVGFRLARTAY
jgi:formylglycine-generating enzyme required for sulfatase activity